jgi:hypothetical protein
MKKSYLRTNIQEITNHVDSDTGEILGTDVKQYSYMANTKEEFFMGYSALIGVFMEMSQAEVRIFGYLLRFVKGVKFDISKKVRIDMAQTININERTILNTIPSLVEKKVIYIHDSGLYQVNPRYAFQGSTVDRNVALKAIIELGCKDC